MCAEHLPTWSLLPEANSRQFGPGPLRNRRAVPTFSLLVGEQDGNRQPFCQCRPPPPAPLVQPLCCKDHAQSPAARRKFRLHPLIFARKIPGPYSLFYENPSLVKWPWLISGFAAVPFFYPSVPLSRLAHGGCSKGPRRLP